jgi:CRISPR-associated endoribonuclease Cas6
MRIKIFLSQNTTEVPVNHQVFLNSYVHKCLGRNNEYHDAKNNYAISSLIGGFLNEEKQTVGFKNGAYFTVSSLDLVLINKILIGAMQNPSFGFGMEFKNVEHVSNETFFNGWNHFITLSPFIIKRYIDKKRYSFVTLDEFDFQTSVKRYLITKLTKIDKTLDLSDFDIIIPRNNGDKVKKVIVKNVLNLGNFCHISIHTNKKVAELLYNIGIGQSTGSGFGTIYKTENKCFYR